MPLKKSSKLNPNNFTISNGMDMSVFKRLLKNCLTLLPALVSIIALFLGNPYIGIVGSIVVTIIVVPISERLSRKQLFNLFLFKIPSVLASIIEIQYRLLGHPMTRILDPITSIIISIYLIRCRHLKQVGEQPKKLEPSPHLKISLTLHCPKCGTELLADAEFCPQCGTKLPPHNPISK